MFSTHPVFFICLALLLLNSISSRRSRNRVIYCTNTKTSWCNWVRPWRRSSTFSTPWTPPARLSIPIKGPLTTGRHSEPVPQPTQPSAQVSDDLLFLQEKYDGTPSKCRSFLLQCSVYQTGALTTERSQVATVISLLTGRALVWATAIWERGEGGPEFL